MDGSGEPDPEDGTVWEGSVAECVCVLRGSEGVPSEVRHHISWHMAERARADPCLTSRFGEEPASPVT